MTSYTTLVNIDAEAAQKLCAFVSELLPSTETQQFLTESKALIDALKTPELIKKILDQSKVIFAIEDESGEFVLSG